MSHGERRRMPWRDNLEAVTMAVVMALLLKYFIVEAYKIPTGSMQPTLIGNDDSGIQDRILVDKLSYVLSDPKRWEVAVFRYPLDRSKNFVKRIVGIGPEEIKIENGDLWNRRGDEEPWRILRRPRAVQESTWKELDVPEPATPPWESLETESPWTFDHGTIVAVGSGRAVYRRGRSITDRYLDGYPESLVELIGRRGSPDVNDVGDLRVEGVVDALPGTAAVVLELREAHETYRFTLPGPAAPGDPGETGASPSIEVRTTGRWNGAPAMTAAGEPRRLVAGRETRFAVQNLDDLLELEIDGEVAVALEVDPLREQRSAVYLELDGEGATFTDLAVFRDIHYLASGASTVEIPAGHYFMLGDNTQDSSDSREWRFVRYGEPGGDGSAEPIRGNFRLHENPYSLPGTRLNLLTDEWGERHWFDSSEYERLPPQEAPFVPRELIQGKALAVFWPFNPRIGVYRLRWVH